MVQVVRSTRFDCLANQTAQIRIIKSLIRQIGSLVTFIHGLLQDGGRSAILGMLGYTGSRIQVPRHSEKVGFDASKQDD